MYDWVFNTPLDGFVEDAPQEELAISPVAECLAVSSTMDTLF